MSINYVRLSKYKMNKAGKQACLIVLGVMGCVYIATIVTILIFGIWAIKTLESL